MGIKLSNEEVRESSFQYDFKPIVREESIKEELLLANKAGFLNGSIEANKSLIPKLLVNDHIKGRKVLSDIIYELNNCEEFFLSVAFITSSGITPLLETFRKLGKRC